MIIVCRECGRRMQTKGKMPVVEAHMRRHLGPQPLDTVLRVYTIGDHRGATAFARYTHPDEW